MFNMNSKITRHIFRLLFAPTLHDCFTLIWIKSYFLSFMWSHNLLNRLDRYYMASLFESPDFKIRCPWIKEAFLSVGCNSNFQMTTFYWNWNFLPSTNKSKDSYNYGHCTLSSMETRMFISEQSLGRVTQNQMKYKWENKLHSLISIFFMFLICILLIDIEMIRTFGTKMKYWPCKNILNIKTLFLVLKW